LIFNNFLVFLAKLFPFTQALILFLTLGMSPSAKAQDIHLRSLSDVSTKVLSLNKVTKNTLIMLFQKDCSACLVQVDDLKCLTGNTEVLLIGAYASEEQLRREYRRMRSQHSAYYADGETLNKLPFKKGLTPQLLLLTADRPPTQWLGYTPCQDIARRIPPSTQ
jgi:hypothetical protein